MKLSLKLQEKVYDFYVYISYFLIFISYFGISIINKKYITYLDKFIKVYISLFLIWRFHPLKTSHGFTDLDRKIAFTAGLLLITTTILNNYIEYIKNYIINIFYLKKNPLNI